MEPLNISLSPSSMDSYHSFSLPLSIQLRERYRVYCIIILHFTQQDILCSLSVLSSTFSGWDTIFKDHYLFIPIHLIRWKLCDRIQPEMLMLHMIKIFLLRIIHHHKHSSRMLFDAIHNMCDHLFKDIDLKWIKKVKYGIFRMHLILFRLAKQDLNMITRIPELRIIICPVV